MNSKISTVFFGKIYLGSKKKIISDDLCIVTIIMIDHQMDAAEFEELFYKMLS